MDCDWFLWRSTWCLSLWENRAYRHWRWYAHGDYVRCAAVVVVVRMWDHRCGHHGGEPYVGVTEVSTTGLRDNFGLLSTTLGVGQAYTIHVGVRVTTPGLRPGENTATTTIGREERGMHDGILVERRSTWVETYLRLLLRVQQIL